MPLTQDAIIEIQTAAKYNTLRLMEESKRQKELAVEVEKAQAAAKAPMEALKKGK